MTSMKLAKTVEEAIALDREIEQKQSRLSELKEMLKAEAETRPDEHTETAQGGWSWTAESPTGDIARVTQDGATLKSRITTDKDILKLRELCGPIFNRLFNPSVVYEPVTGFRKSVDELLGVRTKAIMKVMTSTGRMKVSFETKE